MSAFFDIVFDGPPGPKAGRFVEVEDDSGKSIRLGEWIEREDGYWAIRLGSPTFVVWQNTDLTEGRGYLRPIGHFESHSDALGFARGKDVQGGDCRVTQECVIALPSAHGQIYAPAYIRPASKEGKQNDERAKQRESALIRAKEAGLSDDDISILTRLPSTDK